jgi:hypothetical protein
MSEDTIQPTSENETERPNPYVGPRSFTREDPIHGRKLYGRKLEILQLRASLLAHRIVLFYSRSGAGKTSLIEAGLRPQLEERDFHIFPTIRVGYESPVDEDSDSNRYRLSVISSLETSRPPEVQLSPSEIAGTTLTEYFDLIEEDFPDRDPCYIFDQFEELFTLDPTDGKAKKEVLRELGEALENRGRWAVFSMREDFIARLEPYLGLIPTQFATTYRIEGLSADAALEAITEPSDSLNVSFGAEAADRLVTDLRRTQVQRGDELRLEKGPDVEPVQLQVVCNQLWDSLAEGATEITVDDIEAAGGVNDALAGFYDSQVETAAVATGTDELAIRRWFERQLMSPDGFRTQTRSGPGADGIDVLRILQGSHLIRSDFIRGAEWYEISHDRFVEPIRRSNAAYLENRNEEARAKNTRLWNRIGIGAAVLVSMMAVITVFANMAPGPTEFEALTVNVEETEVRQSQSGTINHAGDIALFPFDLVAGESVVIAVTPELGFEPDVRIREPGSDGLTYAVGFDGLAEPWLLVVPDAVDGRYELIVSGTTDSTGDFDVLVDRTLITDVALGETVTGTLSTASVVDVVRINLLANDLTQLQLIPDEVLGVATYAVFAPDGTLAASGMGESFDRTGSLTGQAGLFRYDDNGEFVVTVTGFDGSTGGYEMTLGRADFRWNVEGLIPASAAGLDMDSYDVVSGATSVTCSDWRDGLLSEEGYSLVPRGTLDHHIWMWSAQFDSSGAASAYVESYGDGCVIEYDIGVVRSIHAPVRLHDDVMWYVTTIVVGEETIIESVGVIAATDKGVADAQVYLLGTDDNLELIVVDPDQPYDSDKALAIASGMKDAVIAIAGDL